MKKKLCQKFNSSVTIIIALFGIAVAIAVASLDLVQSASTVTSDMVAGTFGGEEESLNTTSTSNNNNSNSVLGKLFLTGEDRLTSFNQINQTYTEVSYVGNRTIMPPDSTNTTISSAMTINATETGSLTLKLQPNGIAFFSTNSTVQLTFLDNLISIYQVKASPAGTAIQMWEWKGADLPFGNEDDGTAIIGNQTTTTIPDTL